MGDFLLPGDEMWVGLNTAGTLAVNGGSLLRVGALELAQNGGGVVPVTGISTLTLAGAGSKIELNGAPSGGRLRNCYRCSDPTAAGRSMGCWKTSRPGSAGNSRTKSPAMAMERGS